MNGVFINIECFNKRYWSGNNPDVNILVVDIYKMDDSGGTTHFMWDGKKFNRCDTYIYKSMEG